MAWVLPSCRSAVTSGEPVLSAWDLVREDLRTHRGSRLSAGFHALAVYRLGTALRSSPRLVQRLAGPLYRLARAFVHGVYGIELPLGARIGRRLFLPHPHGIVIVSRAGIGDDCMIRHNVTLGAGSDTRGGWPTVGHRVHFGPGSIVMGDVHIGDDVLIGPNTVVIEDVAAGSRVLAPPAVARPPKRRPAADADRAGRRAPPS